MFENQHTKNKSISEHFYREAKIMAAMPFVLIGLVLLAGLLGPTLLRYFAIR